MPVDSVEALDSNVEDSPLVAALYRPACGRLPSGGSPGLTYGRLTSGGSPGLTCERLTSGGSPVLTCGRFLSGGSPGLTCGRLPSGGSPGQPPGSGGRTSWPRPRSGTSAQRCSRRGP